MSDFPGADIVVGGIFALVVGTVVLGAAIAVLTTRVIRSVCGLALCCLGLAGLYYFLHSPFLALMEILIYVGAVCVTIVFAVMLAEPEEPAAERPVGTGSAVWGVVSGVISLLVFGTLVRVGLGMAWTRPAETGRDGSVAAIGVNLLGSSSLAFELISLVLLVAILGALAIARPGRDSP